MSECYLNVLKESKKTHGSTSIQVSDESLGQDETSFIRLTTKLSQVTVNSTLLLITIITIIMTIIAIIIILIIKTLFNNNIYSAYVDVNS